MNQAQTRMYYNTMAIVDDGVGFIVGLLAEAVAGEKTQLRRQRMLLSYFPDWQVHSQVYPVASTTLA